MSDWHDLRYRRNVIAIPVIWLAFVLSLIVHVAALWEWFPRIHLLARDALLQSEAAAPLTVRLATPKDATPESSPAPKLAEARPAQPAAPRRAPARPPRRTLPAPPAIALNSPQSTVAIPPPAPPFETAPPAPAPSPPPPIESDLTAYIAARRRARGEAESADIPGAAANSPAGDDIARRDRIVASNLASLNTQTFGDGPRHSGGVFQITRMDYADAEFAFRMEQGHQSPGIAADRGPIGRQR